MWFNPALAYFYTYYVIDLGIIQTQKLKNSTPCQLNRDFKEKIKDKQQIT